MTVNEPGTPRPIVKPLLVVSALVVTFFVGTQVGKPTFSTGGYWLYQSTTDKGVVFSIDMSGRSRFGSDYDRAIEVQKFVGMAIEQMRAELGAGAVCREAGYSDRGGIIQIDPGPALPRPKSDQART
jgi:hypothetical protein